MTPEQARDRFIAARVARLATADASGCPHAVPLVFAVAGDTVYSAVDAKPKRSTSLRRMSNVRENPRVSLLVDHYDDSDWDALWWVRADGTGRVLNPADAESRRALELLQTKYPQYRTSPPSGEVLAVDVQRWSGWAGTPGD
ncbi:MAG TPA: TIGR03668 family PPOX class F420-dependent oxidoreductase [Propionibacteriaceae bacterium]|nr:TIGR03668 family PPOX class F420-dependent oxidoreductase [Propionibacteriaceae bacterium]